MIREAAVLEDEFVPNDVAHRDEEMQVLTRALDPLTWGERPETAMLFGPSGTGKTCLAKFAVRELSQETQIRTRYVDCWRDYTRFQALYQILEGVPATTNVRSTLSTQELLSRLSLYDGPPLVVILDEVDELREPEVIGDLQRTRGVSIVLIANRQDELFAGLKEKTLSRLRGTESAVFDRYGVEELTAILAARADRGLRDGAIARDQLRHIADGVAGDARVGITALRTSARIAENQPREGSITDAMIDEAIEVAKDEVRKKQAGRLQPHQRTLYGIIIEYDAISPSALYERYCAREDDPRSKRTMQNYLQKLVHYNLIEARGSGPSREYVAAA